MPQPGAVEAHPRRPSDGAPRESLALAAVDKADVLLEELAGVTPLVQEAIDVTVDSPPVVQLDGVLEAPLERPEVGVHPSDSEYPEGEGSLPPQGEGRQETDTVGFRDVRTRRPTPCASRAASSTRSEACDDLSTAANVGSQFKVDLDEGGTR